MGYRNVEIINCSSSLNRVALNIEIGSFVADVLIVFCYTCMRQNMGQQNTR